LEREDTEIVIFLKEIPPFLKPVHLLALFHFFSLDTGNCWLCEECHGKNDFNFILIFVCFKLLFMKSLQGIIIFIITYISIQAAS